MSVPQGLWPEPSEIFEWFGDANLSRDSHTTVVAVAAEAVQKAYTEWHATHREASERIDELLQSIQDATTDRVDGALKAKIKRLEKELRAARGGAGEAEGLEHQLLKAQGEVVEWKTRFDELFEMNKRTNKLIDDNKALRGDSEATQVRNTVVHKIKPREPVGFDGSQDLEVVTRYLDEVEHYVRQGASMLPKASLDNQHMDTVWRFFSVKIFRWFQTVMKKRGLAAIPPADNDYGITWTEFKTLFKEQFVPEVAVSVVRKEWHALRFNRPQVLKFNRRALELIEILGGSLSISRENPLWEEYLRKLPDGIASDVMQQAQIMRRVNKTNLSLGDMMDIVAERTLPFLPSGTGPPGTATMAAATTLAEQGDPMDLSNAELEDINIIDEKTQCHRCRGYGHIARNCSTPNMSNRAERFKERKEGSHSQRDGSYSRRDGRGYQADGSYSRRDGSLPQREGQQQWRREHHAQRPPTQRQPTQRSPPQKGLRKAGKLFMVGEDQRVYAVDNHEAGSGAYFDGSWDDEEEWELAKGPRVVDLGEVSDGEKGEGLGSEEAGKDRK